MPSPQVRVLGWMATLAAAAIYIFMLTVTLPNLSAMAGGRTMFDIGGGYDLETARAILIALGEEGRRYYANVQHALDTAYPPLMALAVIYWISRFAPRWRAAGWPLPLPVQVGLVVVPILAAMFDLSENALVGQMLDAGPDGLSESLVASAAGMTLAKSIAVSISLTALLVLGLAPVVKRLFRRKA